MKTILLAILMIGTMPNTGFCQNQNKVIGYDLYTKTKSDKAREYYNSGSNHFDHEKFAEAVNDYKSAIAEDTNYIDAYDNLGLTYRHMNMLDSAEYYYLISRKKYPKGTVALMNLGVVEETRRDFKKAITYYTEMLKLAPKDPEATYGLMKMYLNLGKYNEALDYGLITEKCYTETDSPYIGDCYYLLTIIYYGMENKDMTRKYAKLAQTRGMNINQKILDWIN